MVQLSSHVAAALVDVATEGFTPITTMSNTFCGSIVPTHDGKMLLAGGHGAVRRVVGACVGAPHAWRAWMHVVHMLCQAAGTNVFDTCVTPWLQAVANNVTDGKKHIRVYDYQADPQNIGVTATMAWGR
jgi:hypothetical protein